MEESNNVDDVVISGISGVFPNSENVEEFKKNLLAGNDMISSSSRRYNQKGLNAGLMKSIDLFDHSFFRMNSNQARGMTFSAKMLLEKTFEAVLDAGYNPQEIKGKNIAVIGGVWDLNDEGDPAKDRKAESYGEFGGKMVFMLTNRISQWLDVHGPSYPVNTACSSSMYAIDHAIKTIQRGQCEGAIVCASNFCIIPHEYSSATPFLSPDGTSAPFDADANGYVRSEAVVVIFLQKRKHARRIYSTIVHSTTNSDGFQESGSGNPSIKAQVNLYRQFYKETDMDPRKISYIEAHGTGTRAGDVAEATSIEEFFCHDRKTPLKVGSVKSNMGHAEAAAALCSIIKMIIAFETGTIPANLRYNKPNPNIEGLTNGHLEIVKKPIPLEGDYFAINSFGVGGSNGHLVLKPHKKNEDKHRLTNETIPWLVTASGRTEQAVDCILNNIEESQNAEHIRLFHEIFKYGIQGHPYRGYIILKNGKALKTSKKFFSGEKRAIWFIFSGMGSQWPAMGKSLMEIPIFAQSILKSHNVLLSKGLDLVKIISSDDQQILDNILHAFVGIAAIQIALVDLLSVMNIKPDGIIGHSVGELGCGYADGCLTAEQMILIAYYRGLVFEEGNFIHGTMAAVGESYDTMKNLVPPEIDIGCHNGPNSCTISGPTEIMQNFIKTLQEKNIFVRKVNSANIALHSRYIAAGKPQFLSYSKMIIPEPKIRSKKWICTSVLEDKWSSDEVKYCSAEYQANNFANAVFMEEGCRHIPDNAITIEIAPHSLLNAILKRSLPSTVRNIPLTQKNNENGVEYLLNAFGQMYEAGCEMELSHLYPGIEFPVSRSTPMISPLVKWKYEEQQQADFMNTNLNRSNERHFTIDPNSEEYKYLRGHIVGDKNLYPASGYLMLVAEAIFLIRRQPITSSSISFENIHFEQAITIPSKGGLYFQIAIQEFDNHFEIKCNDTVVAKGKVRILKNASKEMANVKPFKDEISNSNILPLNNDDFYKELKLRGYQYNGLFKKVQYVNFNGTYGETSWCNNFITFIDTMLQIGLLQVDSRDTLIPTFIQKVVIDFEKHFKMSECLDQKNPKFPIHYYPYHNLLSSGGIQMSGWKTIEINRQRRGAEPTLRQYQFVPNIGHEKMDLSVAISVCAEIAIQNTLITNVITYELIDQDYDPTLPSISSVVLKTLNNRPSVTANVNVLTNLKELKELHASEEIILSNEKLPNDKSALMIIISNIQGKTELMGSILDTLRDDGFIITRESITENISFENLGFNVCFSRMMNDSEKMIFLNKLTKTKPIKQTIQIKNASYSWVPEVQTTLSNLAPEKDEKLVVYAEKEPNNGILGFVNCLRKEDKGKNIRCFFIMDKDAPAFSLDDPFYKSQYDKNLSHNIYKNGTWGGYWHSALDSCNKVESNHAICMLEERGNLSSLKWTEGPLDPRTYKNSNEKSLVHVYYSGINFKDVMLAVGRISAHDSFANSRFSDCHHGGEFSGKDKNGARLMGIVHGKGIATLVEAPRSITWKVPDSMTLEEAASIPVVYATVIFAFFYKMTLKEGLSVLIHSGSGGIGQAAINICLHYKCNIFTTVGTAEKKEFIKKAFPQIPENHIGNTRDTSFENMIMEQTKGRGVDVVLNSLAKDKLRASVRCVAKGGHFLEIGKFDMAKNNSLELGHFLNDIVFYSVQLDVLLLNHENPIIFGVFNKLQEMLDQGIIKPIQRTVFQIDEVESAFRFMASGKHIGKLIIKIRDEEKNLKAIPTTLRMKVKPRVFCQENKSYIILGGSGGFGLELVDWLILRGAHNIVLSSRTHIRDGYQSYRINLWRSYGVRIIISVADITTEIGVANLIQTANSLGPVAAIFNLAVIYLDGPFSKQTEDKFSMVGAPKAVTTWHLDQLSRKMCPYLEHFVVFSSTVCGYGNIDQTNYGFANSVMERICENRRADNLPALAIQWGPVSEVGILSNVFENNPSAAIGGCVPQEIKSCLETLNGFMKQHHPIVCSMIVAETHKTDSDIISAIANAMGIKDLEAISLTWTLPELGMDSILGLEIKQILEIEFNTFFTTEDLQSMTFAKLLRLKEERKNASTSANDDTLEAHQEPTKLYDLNDEEMWTRSIMQIPLINEKIQEPISIDEKPFVFVFPGIEGSALSMEPLAKNLSLQVLCFQYYFDTDAEKNVVQSLCEYFSSFILEKLRPEQEFHFIGYSLGALIAVETAKILENQGRKGRIWLIDGSPKTVKMIGLNKNKLEENVPLDDDEIQNRICIILIQSFLPKLPRGKYSGNIEKAVDWETKKKISSAILSDIIENKNITHRFFDKVFHTIKAIHYYDINTSSLHSPCVLIRCVKNVYGLPLNESYSLTEHFINPIEVHKLDEVEHSSIPSHPKTAEIIMKSTSWKI